MKCWLYIFATFLSIQHYTIAQNGDTEINNLSKDSFRVMFYNCENYFDCINDSITNDDEFTVEGLKHWTPSKCYKKRIQLSQVITAVGEWNPVDLVGLCEIENYQVLHDLIQNSPIYKYNYNIIHKDSPDFRGIDIALLYRKETFRIIDTQFIEIKFEKINARPTRDIVYVKGIVSNKDTLNVFVNHWSSRYGGQLESEGNRLFIASKLRSIIDSLYDDNHKVNILVMGDFNDEPFDKSLKILGGLKIEMEDTIINEMHNLMDKFTSSDFGTHKYQGKWAVLDQILVSNNLLNGNNLKLDKTSLKICAEDFLLERDEKYMGIKPFRTYSGYKYLGGFSDHLPVSVDLKY